MLYVAIYFISSHLILNDICSIGSVRRSVDEYVFPVIENAAIEVHRLIKNKLVQAAEHSGSVEDIDETNKTIKGIDRSHVDKIDFRLSDMMDLLEIAGSKDTAVNFENSIFMTWLAHSSPTISYLMREGHSLASRGTFFR